MQIFEVQDAYNPAKVWIIKRYKCGHYAVNQNIAGRKFYRRFTRLTAKYLAEIIGFSAFAK